MIDVFLPSQLITGKGRVPRGHQACCRCRIFTGIAIPLTDPTALGLANLASPMEDHCNVGPRKPGHHQRRSFLQLIGGSSPSRRKRNSCCTYRTGWYVIRHRVAQSIHEQLTAAIHTKKLQVPQGKTQRHRHARQRIQLTRHDPRGAAHYPGCGWLLNCTGPLESYKNAKIRAVSKSFRSRPCASRRNGHGHQGVGANFDVIDGGRDALRIPVRHRPDAERLLGGKRRPSRIAGIRPCAWPKRCWPPLEGGASPGWFAEMWVDVVEYVI